MEQSRVSLLRAVWKNKVVRYGAIAVTVLSIWDVLSSQFNLPKIPRVWEMTGALLPLWAWLFMMLAIFVYGIFEYVRLNLPAAAESGAPTINIAPSNRYSELDEEEDDQEPDLDLSTLGVRVANNHGAALQGPDLWRRANLEIADRVTKRGLTVWGRFADFPSKKFTTHEMGSAIFDYRANSIKIPNVHGVNKYTDILLVSEEVDDIWPPEKNALTDS